MGLERRLRQMVLAAGAVAAACSTTPLKSAFVPADASSDATADASFDAGFCCEVISDPCCTFLHCGASLTPSCACELDGGTWSAAPDGTATCRPLDAGPSEAGPK